MLTELTHEECVRVALRAIANYIDQGICVQCALTLVSNSFKIERDKLELTYWWAQSGE